MATGPPTILLVDDEYAALEVLELLLRGEGFEIVTASDGQQALDVAGQRPVDLVITDYKMPGMDGLELCARLQADPRFSSIPIFMMSATYVIEKSPPPGVVAFIQKPIRWAALLQKVQRTLSNQSSV